MKTKRIHYLVGSTFLATSLLIGGTAFAHKDKQGGYEEGGYGKGGYGCQEHRGWFMGKHRGGGGPMGHFKHTLHKLDLTEQQEEEIDTLFDNSRSDFRELRDEMMDQREEFHDLVSADKYNAKKIEAAADAQSKLVKRMMIQGAKLKSDIHAILTPEQREEAKKYKRRFGKHF